MPLSFQSLLSDAFLRATLDEEAGEFQASGQDDALRQRLSEWDRRTRLSETQAEAGFLRTFFFDLWGYWPDGQSGPEAGFTAYPRRAIAGAGAGGNTGAADLALGWFAHPPVMDTPQVVCEFKDIKSDLDAPQRRKGNTRSPVKQCADYLRGLDLPLFPNAPIQPRFGIVSDMNEFRLYWRDRMPAQMMRFVIRAPLGGSETTLLQDTPEAAFQRFLFARLFHRDMLLSKTGEPKLLALIRHQLVREKELEKEFYSDYRKYREVMIDALIVCNPTYPRTKGRMVRLAQKLLDRLIFILFCEDMGQQIAYPPQMLRDRLLRLARDELSPGGDDAWESLRRLFRKMNDGGIFDGKTIQRFNGGLFAPDAELEALDIPNRIFFDTDQGQDPESLRAPQPNLLYFAANYNFGTVSGGKAITLYTLGRIFEQSITELELLEAKKDNRPSLTEITGRKRDGVYYTPEQVVALIVEETVGPRLADLRRAAGWDEDAAFTDEEIGAQRAAVWAQRDAIERYQAELRNLTIVDPACGSGAFLIAALDFLLREFRRTEHERQRLAGSQLLLFDDDAATREILSRNIYGVDINPASIELARLALWLHTARAGSVLSDLDDTIRDGNSLVGPDIANVNSGYALLPETGRERINAFDWAAKFPSVFARGGFDCVIGNPPYVKLQNYKRVMPEVADYLRRATSSVLGSDEKRYASAQTGNTDLFLPFIEKGLSLLRPGGRMGFIAPSLWLLNEYGEGLRRLMHRGGNLDRWMDFRSHQVFDEAITYTALQFFSRERNEVVRFMEAEEGPVVPAWSDPDCAVPYADLPESDAWTLLPRPAREVVKALMARCDRLDHVAAIIVGLQTSADRIYHLKRVAPNRYLTSTGAAVVIEDALTMPLVSGKDVSRWTTPEPVWHILFPYAPDAVGHMRLIPAATMATIYPRAWAYLQSNEAELRGRERSSFNDAEWYRFGRNQNLDRQLTRKLFVAQTVLQMEVAPDPAGVFAADNVRVNCILPAHHEDFWFLLAVLHGRVCDWVFRRIAKPKQGGYFEANRQFIAPLPVPRADSATKQRIGRLARIARAVHTRHARVLTLLQRRLDTCARRTEKPEWLFAGQVRPLADLARDAPEVLRGVARTTWARERQAPQIEAALGRVDILLTSEADLAVRYAKGELSLNASGQRLFDRIFLNERDGAFIALQWRLLLRERRFSGPEGARELSALLRVVRRTDNASLHDQVLTAGRQLFGYDAMIARIEAALDAELTAAYALSDDEQAVIAAKRNGSSFS